MNRVLVFKLRMLVSDKVVWGRNIEVGVIKSSCTNITQKLLTFAYQEKKIRMLVNGWVSDCGNKGSNYLPVICNQSDELVTHVYHQSVVDLSVVSVSCFRQSPYTWFSMFLCCGQNVQNRRPMRSACQFSHGLHLQFTINQSIIITISEKQVLAGTCHLLSRFIS